MPATGEGCQHVQRILLSRGLAKDTIPEDDDRVSAKNRQMRIVRAMLGRRFVASKSHDHFRDRLMVLPGLIKVNAGKGKTQSKAREDFASSR